MKKLFSKTKIVLALVAIFIIGVAATSTTSYFEISKNLEIFATLYKELNSYYVDDIDPNEFMQEGIDAMLKSLDPYTSFYSEAEIENYRFQTTGKYGGIGSLIKQEGDYIVITEPYKGYPADEAGLIAGDKIVRVDQNEVKGKSSSEVSKLLKGEPGTSIEVEVLRPQLNGSDEILTLDITRREVKVKNVPYYGMASENIGYIKLRNFTQKAGKEVEDAFNNLKSNNDLKGVILDVRGNPGGLLHEAVNICNVFIPKGQLIVTTKGKVKEWEKEFKTLNTAVDTEIPLAVLTSTSSASASEIVGGSIQDLDRGVVIGQRTFGKGLVQTTRKLEYNTQLKVTTAKYYIPSGRCIQAINYAERDENGAISKIPDSLQVAFTTKNGRTVYDGGGIKPDIVTDVNMLSDITISLLRKDLIFDYATYYKLKYNDLLGAQDYRMTDDEYNEFVTWLQDKEYDYTTQSEKLVADLEKTTEQEKYYNAISAELEDLKQKLAHDKENDLKTHKSEIKQMLENEIVRRYYYKEGAIQNGFVYDVEMKEAIEILNNKSIYNEILTKN